LFGIGLFKVRVARYGVLLMVEKLKDFPCMDVRIRPYGERGYLLDALNDDARFLIERALALEPPTAYEESVPGTDNLLLLFVRPPDLSALRDWLDRLEGSASKRKPRTHCLEVPVVYDGPDLKAVAQATGLSVAEVITIHTAPEYRVRLMGFAPGFPYLDGLDPRLHLDRKASPRDRIEPGAVAIGGSHAGIYSVASPGGWHLFGRTDLVLFQPEKAKGTPGDPRAIFALAPGDLLKFKQVEG
jgi:KipI family sensor histidine kinase inhibitor